MQYLSNLLW